jgi:hypothetical protein
VACVFGLHRWFSAPGEFARRLKRRGREPPIHGYFGMGTRFALSRFSITLRSHQLRPTFEEGASRCDCSNNHCVKSSNTGSTLVFDYCLHQFASSAAPPVRTLLSLHGASKFGESHFRLFPISKQSNSRGYEEQRYRLNCGREGPPGDGQGPRR